MNHPEIFRISPLVRVTLLSLYAALTVPLPFLPRPGDVPVTPELLWVAIGSGGTVLYGALEERVKLDAAGIHVTYPGWVPRFFRSGWSLDWSDIRDIKCRSTGQGGLVYYFLSRSSERAFLLPVRVAGFARLLKLVEERTNLDTTHIRPLSQPWMYGILFLFTLVLSGVDAWTIFNALSFRP